MCLYTLAFYYNAFRYRSQYPITLKGLFEYA